MKELDPVSLYIPESNQLVIIKEGSGDNLSKQEREEGYKDYIYYTQYSLEDGECEEVDGGIIIEKEFLQDKYKTLYETISSVLRMAYDGIPEYIILKKMVHKD